MRSVQRLISDYHIFGFPPFKQKLVCFNYSKRLKTHKRNGSRVIWFLKEFNQSLDKHNLPSLSYTADLISLPHVFILFYIPIIPALNKLTSKRKAIFFIFIYSNLYEAGSPCSKNRGKVAKTHDKHYHQVIFIQVWHRFSWLQAVVRNRTTIRNIFCIYYQYMVQFRTLHWKILGEYTTDNPFDRIQ